MRPWIRLSALPLAAGAVLLINSLNAAAFTSGTTGYDIGYLQCNSTYPNGAFGIVGVDSGWPFISSLHPGNPCLAGEYAANTSGGLYVNTGYDPSYTDSNHTTADCTSQSAYVTGTSKQQAAWAVGCSEAEKDLAYASSVGVTNPVGGWSLDVETANSWCGLPGTRCRDRSLNQYTVQGLIDTFGANSTSSVGIYSNNSQWSKIMGTFSPLGASFDWYASGASTQSSASQYCGSAYSFSGAPVTIAQYVPTSSTDLDYAC